MTALGERAVVLGGSMAGLLAARVLADRFGQVVLLERDVLAVEPSLRKGVPQARHTHAVLGAGQRVAEALFPGIRDALCAEGAVLADPLAEGRRFIGGGYHCRSRSAFHSLLVSRPTLEAEVRRRVRALPNVQVRDGVDIVGLTASEDRSRVTGALVEQDGVRAAIAADLVVDATGRGTRTPRWLAELGYPALEEEYVECGAAYATRLFRAAPGQIDDLRMVLCPPSPGSLRGAVLLRQEGERWTLTLMGLGGERPPVEPAAFTAWAESLPAGEIGELARTAEPLGDPIPATFPANVRRRYERMARFPERFAVVGDAVCSFNPMYGQGMSVAALEVRALQETLEEGSLDELGPRFFRRAAAVLDAPWLLAAGNDTRLTRPDAEVPRAVRLTRWYMDRLHRAARRDAVVATAFLRVTGLVAPLGSLFKPGIALRVLAARG